MTLISILIFVVLIQQQFLNSQNKLKKIQSIMTYQTVNGCTHSPSKQQILTILLYLIILCLHSIYVVPGIAKISNSILYILLGLHYITLIIIIYDYIWITVHDPVDRVVLDPQLLSIIKPYKIQDCETCGKRQLDSYHCKRCGRCTEDFDHHCKFLNNCIGRRNYQHFLRLLSVNMIYLPLVLIQCVWVFIMAQQNEEVRQSIPKSHWVIIGIICISGFLLILQAILLGFHCYISCLDLTTLDYIRKEDYQMANRESKYQQKIGGSKLKEFRNSIIEYENEERRGSLEAPTTERNLKVVQDKNKKSQQNQGENY